MPAWSCITVWTSMTDIRVVAAPVPTPPSNTLDGSASTGASSSTFYVDDVLVDDVFSRRVKFVECRPRRRSRLAVATLLVFATLLAGPMASVRAEDCRRRHRRRPRASNPPSSAPRSTACSSGGYRGAFPARRRRSPPRKAGWRGSSTVAALISLHLRRCSVSLLNECRGDRRVRAPSAAAERRGTPIGHHETAPIERRQHAQQINRQRAESARSRYS